MSAKLSNVKRRNLLKVKMISHRKNGLLSMIQTLKKQRFGAYTAMEKYWYDKEIRSLEIRAKMAQAEMNILLTEG